VSLFKLDRKVKRNNDRAINKGLVGDLDTEEYIKICKLFDYGCAYCGKPHANSLDHVVPLSDGGGTTISNCVPSCERCNQNKSSREVHEFEEWRHTSEERAEKIELVLNLKNYTGGFSVIDVGEKE